MSPTRSAISDASTGRFDTTIAYEEARRLVSHVKMRWQNGQDADAASFLLRHPGLAKYRALVMDLAYEEFCIRQESGDDIDTADFCRRFPSIGRSLFKQIQWHDLLHDNSLAGLPKSVDWPEPGQEISDFTILEELGQGAFARVYLCLQRGVGDRQVVVKVAKGGSQEAELLGRLKHPNIVPIFSISAESAQGLSCLCMPFRGRSTLTDVLDSVFGIGALPRQGSAILRAANQYCLATDEFDRVQQPARQWARTTYVEAVLLLAIQIAKALDHGHKQGILHADLKPSNVLVTPGGEAMLLDFNLSYDRQNPDSLTGGTLPYMSPEQVRKTLFDDADSELDVRSDVFSFGAVMFEMLNGRSAFGHIGKRGDRHAQAERLFELHRNGPKWPRTNESGVNQSLGRLINRCVAADPSQRPSSMSDVIGALERELMPAKKIGRWYVIHRRRAIVELGLFSASLIGWSLLFGSRPRPYVQFWRKGQDLYREEEFEGARDQFVEAIRINPSFAAAHYEFGRCLLAMEQYYDALERFKIAKRFTHSGHVDACIAVCQQVTLDSGKALKSYRAAKAAGLSTAGLHNNLGYLLATVGDKDPVAARKNYVSAVTLAPRSITVNYNLIQFMLKELARRASANFQGPRIDKRAWKLAVQSAVWFHSKKPKNAKCMAAAAHILAREALTDPDMKTLAIDCLSAGVLLRMDWDSLVPERANFVEFIELAKDPRYQALKARARQQTPTNKQKAPIVILDPITSKGIRPVRGPVSS